MSEEPNLRDPGIDALRLAATVRVVAWHITGWAALTYVAAIPVMFAITGMLLSSGLHAAPARSLVWSRLRRLLPAFWWFSACMLPVLVWFSTPRTELLGWRTLAWVLPVVDPPGTTWESGWVSSPLWYLRAYLQVLFLLPLWWWVARRAVRVWAPVWVALVVLLEIRYATSAWAVQDLVLYGGFTVCGLLAARRRPSTRSLFAFSAASAVLAAVAVWWFRPEGWVVNNSHTSHLFVGLATSSAALAVLPHISSLVSRFSRSLRATAAVSLSVYLWHSPVYALTRALVARFTDSTASPVLAAAWFPLLLLSVLVLVVFAERTELRIMPRSFAAPVVLAVLATVVALPARGVVDLPPTPSRAPAAPSFAFDPDLAALAAPAPSSIAAAPVLQDAAPAPSLGPSRPSTEIISSPDLAAPSNDVPDHDLSFDPSRPVPGLDELAPRYEEGDLTSLQLLLERLAVDNDLDTVELLALTPGRGWTHLAAGGEVRDRTVQYNSITKSFTAVLLFRAVAEGRIGLDEPLPRLEKFGFFDVIERFTLRDVLYHRTGLAPYTDTDAFKKDWRSIDSPAATLRALADTELLFAPGSRSQYSSSNYVVAGLLLEQIYGSTVEDQIKDGLLQPLGLTDTTVRPPAPGAPGTGTGNMYGTLPDLARWAYAHWRTRSLLSPSSYRTAFRLDPSTFIGAGMFGFCPCTGSSAAPVPSALGMNGVQVSLRYYPTTDTILVWFVPTPSGLPAVLDDASIDVLRALP